MRVSKIKNTSQENVDIKLKKGPKISLPPNGLIENADISNLEELRGRTDIVLDLSEIDEKRRQGTSRQLFD